MHFALRLALSLAFIFELPALSISEQSPYPDFCQKAASDDEVFKNFKRSPTYRQILEHVSYEEGLAYLERIEKHSPKLLEKLDRFRINDRLGNPTTYDYGKYGRFSPTTLRYIQVAGDLIERFGDLSRLHIVEIGGGYGGQCAVLKEACGFASYSIIDLKQCNALSEKYLNALGITGIRYVEAGLYEPFSYDLVISNYAFSEISEDEQRNYLDHIIEPTPYGYMIVNFVSQHFNIRSLGMEEIVQTLVERGRKGKVQKEEPLSAENNVLLTWSPSEEWIQIPDPAPALPPMGRTCQPNNAITYSFSGGRLGDNLLSYCHAKWLSYRYGMPFHFKAFDHSQWFCLDPNDKNVDSMAYRFHFTVKDPSEITDEPYSILYTVPYFSECRPEFELSGAPPRLFDVDWEDSGFRSILAANLAPKLPVKTLDLPKNYLTVGMHVRRGGGIDPEHFKEIFPLKFAPDSYYIEQLEKLAAIFDQQNIYVYLFTDDPHPEEIACQYAEALDNPRIIFDYRKEANGPDMNILEDFYSLMKFDCLILCQSNFSLIASKLGNYTFKITPLSCKKLDGIWTVDEIEWVFNGGIKSL